MTGWIVTPVRWDRGQGWLTSLPDVHVRTRWGVWRARRWLNRLGLTAKVSRDYSARWHAAAGGHCRHLIPVPPSPDPCSASRATRRRNEVSETNPTPAQVIAAAHDVFQPEYVTAWLRSKNKMLDGHSPADLIEAGKGQRVLDLLDMLASGAFAWPAR